MRKQNESSPNNGSDEKSDSKGPSRGFYRTFIVFDIFYVCYDSVQHRTVLAIVMGFCAIVMLDANNKRFGSYW